MNTRSFSLKPFPTVAHLPLLKITGDIGRTFNALSISYELSGPLEEVAVPEPTDTAARRNGLWEETCLEFFLGVKDSDRYWEFNLSPAGHWNIYRFASYRQGMQEETAFTSLPFSVRTQPETLQLFLELALDRIILPEQPLQVGISAVIKTIQGGTSWWALTHPGPRADFHRRDGFIIEL